MLSKNPLKSPIFIVEDSDDDFFSTQRIFRKLDIQTPLQRFRNGEDVHAFFQQVLHSPDTDLPESFPMPSIILLDLNLPGLDGREVLRIIKSEERLRHIPVVVLSSCDSPKDIETCYRFGANSYMLKSLQFDRLYEHLRVFFDYWFGVAQLPPPKLARE